jgi:hypothetical protein
MRISITVRALAVASTIATAAFAQNATNTQAAPGQAPAAAPEAAPPKRVTVTAGIDFASDYFFRGIRQQDEGSIVQPYIDVGIAGDNGVSFNVGNWDSIHSSAPAGHWYESDYYASVTFTAGKLKPGLLYTSYTSPADSFATVHELAGVVAIDDSASTFPLAPKAVLAFELGDGQADGGANKGVYLELGVKPAIKLAPKATLLVPVKLGMSLKDYYEGLGAGLSDDKFGFFDAGLQLSIAALSGKAGSLEVHGGFDVLWLGDNLKALNGGDGVKPIVLVGLTYSR